MTRGSTVFLLARTVTYATLFVGLFLVFLPGSILTRAGITSPAATGPLELVAVLLAVSGAALALWCIFSFVFLGKGTPAPFDPPRRLVVAGPYRYVRNPMYLGAAALLSGAALRYQSIALLLYAAGFVFAMHLFVVLYEEPALRERFGAEYEAYRAKVRRWLPHG